MAIMPIEIANLAQTTTGDLQIVLDKANALQSEFRFSILDDTCGDDLRLLQTDDFDSGTFFDVLRDKKEVWKGYHPFMIGITDSYLRSDNWGNLFSARESESGIAVSTSYDWESFFSDRRGLRAYLLHQIAVHVLSFIVPGKLHHRETRSCIYDFKKEKTSIGDAIMKGRLCDACKKWFHKFGATLSGRQLSAIEDMLKEASNMLSHDEAKKKIFVGSSVEGLKIARALKAELDYDHQVEIWNQSAVFKLGNATMEALEEALETYDFALFVFTPDDEIVIRNKQGKAPRDNVIFECGLFIGRKGRHRAFIVSPRDVEVQIPSDLLSITPANYEWHSDNIQASVGTACDKVRQAITAVS